MRNRRNTTRLNESTLHKIIKESVKRVLRESKYKHYFDWAQNSNASPDEIEAAGKRHDSRIQSIYEPIDNLERRRDNFKRYQARVDNNRESRHDMMAHKKFDIKNDRSGGKLFTDRLMNALTRPFPDQRLNESTLHKIIKESVKRVLREGGNLFWRDADGVAHTNSKTYYRGVPGALFVYYGEWADPEILYKGNEINYYDIEDILWNWYNEFIKYESESVKEKFSKDMGVDAIPDNNDVYEKFIEWYGGVDFVQGVLDNFVWEMDD